jgi:hypothetical protein
LHIAYDRAAGGLFDGDEHHEQAGAAGTANQIAMLAAGADLPNTVAARPVHCMKSVGGNSHVWPYRLPTFMSVQEIMI